MKTTFKKLIALVAVAFAVAGTAFAVDLSDVLGVEYLTSATEDELAAELYDVDALKNDFASGLMQSLGTGVKVIKFFAVTAENADDEDYEMIDAVEEAIEFEWGSLLEEDDIYMTSVMRDFVELPFDGWVVYTHVDAYGDFTHYAFYFAFTM